MKKNCSSSTACVMMAIFCKIKLAIKCLIFLFFPPTHQHSARASLTTDDTLSQNKRESHFPSSIELMTRVFLNVGKWLNVVCSFFHGLIRWADEDFKVFFFCAVCWQRRRHYKIDRKKGGKEEDLKCDE